jgi:hypothetical protein
VSFTGSTATGKKINSVCSSDLKRVTLECGGNDAAIVRADADVEAAAKGTSVVLFCLVHVTYSDLLVQGRIGITPLREIQNLLFMLTPRYSFHCIAAAGTLARCTWQGSLGLPLPTLANYAALQSECTCTSRSSMRSKLRYGARFRQGFTLEDAIGSHACSLEASMHGTNGIPLG